MAIDRTISGGARTASKVPNAAVSGVIRALGALLVGAAILVPTSCRTTGDDGLARAAAKVRLVGPIWTCVQLGGKKIEIDPEPTVLFGADGRVSGSSGVNRYFGKFLRSDSSKLTFSEVASTRRAGTPEQAAVEVEFLKGLEATTEFKVTGQGIQLLAGDAVVMELSAVTDPESWIPQPPLLEGPPGSMEGNVEWLKLTSGEWLKGEFKALRRDTVEFDSDELDNLNIDWNDVAELYTTRQFTILLEDRQTLIGALRVNGDRIVLRSAGGQEVLSRSDVQRMVPGEPSERNYWSGNFDIAATARDGNTDQLDITTRINALRRSAHTRLDLGLEAIYGTQNGAKVTNNQRLKGNFDQYISSRLFWTILGIEIYADEFQNIARRTAPYTALGYTLYDRSGLESNVSLGVGYRNTVFDSVGADEEKSDNTTFLQVSADIDADLTEKIEFVATYWAQIGLQDVENTNQNVSVELDFDFMDDFDVFVRATLSRVGQPAANEDGELPEKNDYRYDFGWRWAW